MMMMMMRYIPFCLEIFRNIFWADKHKKKEDTSEKADGACYRKYVLHSAVCRSVPKQSCKRVQNFEAPSEAKQGEQFDINSLGEKY